MLTIVVGTGYTGQRILPLLPNESVIGISRSAIDTDRRTHVFDLDAPSSLPIELPRKYGVIYTVPPAGHPPDRRLSALLERLRPAPSRFVYISTTGVYGDRGGAIVTEATPVHPENERSRLRVAAEELLRDWAMENRCKLVILRAPGIYGPGRLGIESLRAGAPVLREEDASPGNRIHVDDLAACCVAALAPAIPAGLYNAGDNDHRSSTWFSGEVARQAGLPPPREVSREQAEHEFSVQRMSFLRESRVVDTAKMRDVLGVTPRYANPEDGIRASLS